MYPSQISCAANGVYLATVHPEYWRIHCTYNQTNHNYELHYNDEA